MSKLDLITIFFIVFCLIPVSMSFSKCSRQPWWIKENNYFRLDFCCPPEHFHLSGMPFCHPWLTCSDMNSIILGRLIGLGAIKAVYAAHWNDNNIAFSVLNNEKYKDDFRNGIKLLKILNPSQYIIQLVGFCEEDHILLTEYHEFGNAVNITKIANGSIITRLKLCLNYAQILNYLHMSPAGKRVFCDSNDLWKLLSQLLITDQLTLLLNDVDALPEVNHINNEVVKCGHKQITSTFVAPEQLWTSQGTFVDEKMLGYDEKTDIWKVAAVCNHFLSNALDKEIAQYYLFSLHKRCMNVDPTMRPTAENLVVEYSNIITDLDKNYD